jgi:hypothetical protein
MELFVARSLTADAAHRVQIFLTLVRAVSDQDPMSLSIKPKNGRRPFAVAMYSSKPTKIASGRSVFLAQDIHKCPGWDCECNEPCCISRVSFRERKTGSVSTLEVMNCSVHSITFTVYPYGDVPYGRQSLVPINGFGETRFPALGADGVSGDCEPIDAVQQLKENLEYRCSEIRIEKRIDETTQALSDSTPTKSMRDTVVAREAIVQHYQEFSEHPYLPSLFLGAVSMSFGIRWSRVYRVSESLRFSISGSEKTQRRHTKGFLSLFGLGRVPAERASEKVASLTGHKVTAFQIEELARTMDSVTLAKRILEVIRPFTPCLKTYFELLALGTEAGFWGQPCLAR